ncbi:MAG: hypothetical protein AAB213_01540 [Candidatus Omnitrophota bacterium]
MTRRALALVNVLLFVLIFTILAGITLTIVSSQTRLMETYIRRVKGYYVAESGAVAAFDSLSRGEAITIPNVEWIYDSATGVPTAWRTPYSITSEPGSGVFGTTRINSTFNYSTSW